MDPVMEQVVAGRFVALGDSFTEGVGDPHLHYPNGLRGWADRMARQLGRQDSGWEYANLALRSRTLDQIVAQQLKPALAMQPTHVSFYAGGNDLLSLRTDLTALMSRYESALQRLVGGGVQVLVFTAFDTRTTWLLEPLRRRVLRFNDAVRDLAQTYDAVLVDHTLMREYEHPSLWAPDRIHMSRQGHKRMAAFVLGAMGVTHSLHSRPVPPQPPRTWTEVVRDEAVFVHREVLPLVRRRVLRSPSEVALPKWPTPIRPAEGMKRLASRQAAASARARPPDHQGL